MAGRDGSPAAFEALCEEGRAVLKGPGSDVMRPMAIFVPVLYRLLKKPSLSCGCRTASFILPESRNRSVL